VDQQIIVEIFHSEIERLIEVVKKDFTFTNIKNLLLDFQIKKAAFLIIEDLYKNLPRPLKDKNN
jgi:hypothetical protein